MPDADLRRLVELPGAALFTNLVKGAGFSHAKHAVHDEKTNGNGSIE